MTAVDAWTSQIHQLTHAIERRWPHHQPALEEIRSIANEIARLLPLTEDYTSPGDGLRSPSFTGGGRSIGSHADPVTTDRSPKADRALDTSTTARRDTTHALRLALSTEDDQARKQHITHAKAAATTALTPLHRLLPPANLITRIRQDSAGDPGCASCRRIKGPDSRTPFFSDTRTPGSRLCGACENVTRERRQRWQEAHSGQPLPGDPRRFWPPTEFVEHLRDHGHTRATPGQWAEWEAAERARNARKRKRTA